MLQNTEASMGPLLLQGKFLLILRDNKTTIPDPNKWSFIGGVRDGKELAKETFIREVKEEIGIDLVDAYFLLDLIEEGKVKHVFFAELTKDMKEKIKLGNEGQALKFFTLEEMARLDLARTTATLLTEYTDELERIISK